MTCVRDFDNVVTIANIVNLGRYNDEIAKNNPLLVTKKITEFAITMRPFDHKDYDVLFSQAQSFTLKIANFKKSIGGVDNDAVLYELYFRNKIENFPFLRHFDFANFVIAGGSLIYQEEFDADIDFFYYNCTKNEFLASVQKHMAIIVEYFEDLGVKDITLNIIYSENAMTVLLGSSCQYFIKNKVIHTYQFIHKFIAKTTFGEILHNFDLGCCMVAYDGKDFYTNPVGAFAMSYNANVIIPDYHKDTTKRIEKYIDRGHGMVFYDKIVRLKTDLFQNVPAAREYLRKKCGSGRNTDEMMFSEKYGLFYYNYKTGLIEYHGRRAKVSKFYIEGSGIGMLGANRHHYQIRPASELRNIIINNNWKFFRIEYFDAMSHSDFYYALRPINAFAKNEPIIAKQCTDKPVPSAIGYFVDTDDDPVDVPIIKKVVAKKAASSSDDEPMPPKKKTVAKKSASSSDDDKPMSPKKKPVSTKSASSSDDEPTPRKKKTVAIKIAAPVCDDDFCNDFIMPSKTGQCKCCH